MIFGSKESIIGERFYTTDYYVSEILTTKSMNFRFHFHFTNSCDNKMTK